MKKNLYIFLLTIIFSFLIFYIKNYFFGNINQNTINQIEENYIDPAINIKTENKTDIETNIEKNKENKEIINNIIKNKLISDYESIKNIEIVYIPYDFEKNCTKYSDNLLLFLNTKKIRNKIFDLNIELYKQLVDVRGKMKNKSIKLYGILNMNNSEFLGVFIHEFAHYIDLYYLEKKVIKDISEYFYKIAWDSTKIIKSGLKQEDFVSGYAMTNKYEDFAESFTYYVLHNSDFLEKSKKSEILLKKYNFFEKNIFIYNEFKNINFSTEKNIKNYYRDITKIDYNLKNFLQYLKN